MEEQARVAKEEFMNYKEIHGYNNETTQELQKKYNRLQSKINNIKNQNIQNKTDTRSPLEIDAQYVANDIIELVDRNVDKADLSFIDELIYNTDYYKKNSINTDEVDIEELGMTEDDVYNYNQELYDEISGTVNDLLKKEGIESRYDSKENQYYYDRQNVAEEGYNELLKYLDENNIDYEISESIKAGYVPSIYVKNADGDVVFRIANHENNYISDHDYLYDDAYNTIFNDKQYLNWRENILPELEKRLGKVTKNQVKLPVKTNIKQTKGNIPINEQYLNKYASVREIFDNESNNYDGKINVRTDLDDVNNIDLKNIKIDDAKKLAVNIFDKYNNKKVFNNNGNLIEVSKSGIEESVKKIFSNQTQRNMLKEHLKVFSDLGDIIEHANLVNQATELKDRNGINYWNYYFDGLIIDNKTYSLEFDVRSMDSGSNQYRVQRLELKKKKVDISTGDASNNTRILPAYETSTHVNNDTIKSQKSQIAPLPNTSNMQNMQKNELKGNNILNPIEISKLRPKDANTTPTLPDRTYNKNNDGNSHFFENIRTKTNMLNENQKNVILNEDDVKYYDKITNKVTLEKAFERLNENGVMETNNWFAKDSEKATAVDVAEGWILLKQYADKNDADGMVAVAKKLRDMGTKAGQTVQAFNIMERMSPEGMVKYAQSELSEAYEKMVKNKSSEWIEKYRDDFDLKPEEVSFIMKTMEEVQHMEDGYDKRVKLAEIQKVMTDKLPPERGAGIKAWMRISMLFNPKTQVRNVMGNAVIAPVNYFSDLFSSIADESISKKTGVRTIGKTDLKSYAKGFKTGLYQSYNDFKKGINTRDINGNRFEIGQGKSFNDNTKLGKSLNRVDSLLSFMLDAGDRGFYEASFTNSINNQLVLNNTTEVTQEMIDIATQEALSRTWQDNNGYTKFVLQTRKALNKINVKGYGLGDVLIPFAKTPANLTKAIVDYSPAGLVKTIIDGNNLKKSLTNGQYNAQLQHQFVQELGKATAGTMLYILGYALAKAGIVSGESDDDKDTRDFIKNTLGVSSYSIKIGNKSFTYDWAQPIAAPLSIMANYVQKSEKNKDASKLENLISSLDVAGNILLQQSFMESINTVLSNNDGIATGIQEAIMELPSRAIPTLMKQIVDLTDGTQRQTFEYDQPLKTAINKVKAKIPGLSQTLSPAVDTMGREIQKYGGKNNIFNVFFNPANVSTENVSASAKEIYDLYKQTGETTIMPRVAPYYVNKNGNKIVLDSKQRAEYQKISGKIIEENIDKLIGDSNYNNLSNEEKVNIISNIVNFSYNVAQSQILGTEISNTYKKAYIYSLVGNVSDYYLYKSQKFEADYYPNGDVIVNSKKMKIIRYINSLNLSIPEKAILIKMEYNNYNNYNSQIVSYINKMNYSILEKATLLKSLGFNNYDKYIINQVNSQNISIEEKIRILESLGFTIRNGRVYY